MVTLMVGQIQVVIGFRLVWLLVGLVEKIVVSSVGGDYLVIA